MWTQIPTPWQACLGLSWQSNCEGSLPIGAVITDSDGAIVARPFDGLGRQFDARQRGLQLVGNHRQELAPGGRIAAEEPHIRGPEGNAR